MRTRPGWGMGNGEKFTEHQEMLRRLLDTDREERERVRRAREEADSLVQEAKREAESMVNEKRKASEEN